MNLQPGILSMSDIKKIYRKHFFDHFRYRLQFIKERCSDRELETVILVSSALDALSIYKFGRGSSNRKFCRFILSYSGLQDIYNKISLPSLKQKLEKMVEKEMHKDNNCTGKKKFIEFLTNELGVKDQDYMFLNYNEDNEIDIPFEILKDKALQHFLKEEHAETIRILEMSKEYSYIEIFWREYRCLGVHESALMRERAAMNLGESTEPFYAAEGVFNEDKIEKTVPRFDIPVIFTVKTLENCISNFERECNEQDLDPRNFIKN